jgi:acylphosphatase
MECGLSTASLQNFDTAGAKLASRVRGSGRIPCRLTGAKIVATQGQQARRFFISGLVQGVGFRFYAQRVADRHGVSGYVKNLRDGRVEVYAIGSAQQLDALRNDLERGPQMASVDRVEEDDATIEPRYLDGFQIERDWL